MSAELGAVRGRTEHGLPRAVGCEEMRRPGEVARRSAWGLREVPECSHEVLGDKRLLEETGAV
jgi:hypothetical protein